MIFKFACFLVHFTGRWSPLWNIECAVEPLGQGPKPYNRLVLRLMEVLFTVSGAKYRMGIIRVQFSKPINWWLDRSIFTRQFQVSKCRCISEPSENIWNLEISYLFLLLVIKLNGIDLNWAFPLHHFQCFHLSRRKPKSLSATTMFCTY